MNVSKLMVVALAGWINQQQEDVIDYLREEVSVLHRTQEKVDTRILAAVVSRNTISTECADFQSIGRSSLEPVSDRA